jgi:hypothetical protein
MEMELNRPITNALNAVVQEHGAAGLQSVITFLVAMELPGAVNEARRVQNERGKHEPKSGR